MEKKWKFFDGFQSTEGYRPISRQEAFDELVKLKLQSTKICLLTDKVQIKMFFCNYTIVCNSNSVAFYLNTYISYWNKKVTF